MVETARPRRRRWLRWGAVLALLVAVLHAGAIAARLPVAWTFDAAINVGFAPVDETLRAPDDGRRRVVVLEHGLFRTAASLWRLERTLRAHGYEVWNEGYACLTETIEQAAARLHALVERVHRDPVDELSFVGHSMGGLVVHEYLRRPDAREPHRCVYLATPHRGAVLADLRKHWWLFRLVMGDAAALQLSPGDPLHRRPIPWLDRSGALVGTLGEGNPSIPGDDDGTVAVAEARLPGAAATAVLPYGHTRMGMHPEVCREVLRFLRDGAFAAAALAR